MIIAWIKAFRLRTLPLSFSVIIVGSALAWQAEAFGLGIFLLALLTTLFLQILSNLSNDYGDAVSGVDFCGRIGPERMVQSGAITPQQMKCAMWVFAALALLSGVALLLVAYPNLKAVGFETMLIVGLCSIAAAVCYTVGRKPYGYLGLGDLFVFIFFGLVGVGGSYALYTGTLGIEQCLPAASIGLLSVGVLNMNNMRDFQSDSLSGKKTLVVRIGLARARVYHVMVMTLAIVLIVAYVFFWGEWWQLLALLATPKVFENIIIVLRERNNTLLDSQLKEVSVATFLLSLLFAAGTFIASL